MAMIHRSIQKKIEDSLFQNKIVVIYGARQVGKTTLVREIQKKYLNESVYLNCDEPDVRASLTDKTSTELKEYFGNKKLIIIDEAQRVENIGLTLKLAFDTFPETQIIATGSSSFDLANKIVEPLTGRKIEFLLLPISITELGSQYSDTEIKRTIENRMVYGMYPGVLFGNNEEKRNLEEISRSYLYKDVLMLDRVRNPEGIEKLMKALALQIGQEVSYNELALTTGLNRKTVENYIRILEQAFIIFRLKPYYKNARNELTKLRKIYFYDLGIRNVLISNLNTFDKRNDIGPVWENFVISERIKKNNNMKGITPGSISYFWRTTDRQEIDYIEDIDGIISAYEIKVSNEKGFLPKVFSKNYPGGKFTLINKDNFLDFVK